MFSPPRARRQLYAHPPGVRRQVGSLQQSGRKNERHVMPVVQWVTRLSLGRVACPLTMPRNQVTNMSDLKVQITDATGETRTLSARGARLFFGNAVIEIPPDHELRVSALEHCRIELHCADALDHFEMMTGFASLEGGQLSILCEKSEQMPPEPVTPKESWEL